MKVGVFDSGVGGLSVARAIQKALPNLEVILREDKEHVPYGTRQPAEILSFVLPIFRDLVRDGCDVIVVACNTVSTTLMPELRQNFSQPLLAVEPMVKPAAKLTKSKVIAVCATPTTLASSRYHQLKKRYAQTITVLEPDCHDWSHMIEHQQVNEKKIRVQVEEILNQRADVIVLGCTHYHWIEKEIEVIANGQAQVLQPEPIVVQQLKQLLTQLSGNA